LSDSSRNNPYELLRLILEDPIGAALLKSSNLTRRQLYTLIADQLRSSVEESGSSKRTYVKLRGSLSRGSFNRSLKQARANIVEAIYTILLLAYIGIFDSPRLQPFLEFANHLHEYLAQKKAQTISQAEIETATRFAIESLHRTVLELAGVPNPEAHGS